MQQRDFELYLERLVRATRAGRREREEIRRELRAHLRDALDDAHRRGITPERAIREVLDDLGDAEQLAELFDRHNRKRRWMMQTTMAAACVGFAILSYGLSFNRWQAQPDAPRDPFTASVPPRGPAADDAARENARIAAALGQRISEVRFEEVPLADVFAFVKQQLGVNVHVQWPMLEMMGVDRDLPIRMSLDGVSVERLLQLVLHDTDSGATYGIVDGILLITSPESLRRDLDTVVYDVRPLIGSISREEMVPLLTLVIEPDTWVENGGEASMTLISDLLVVRQYRAVHPEIERLLSSLRDVLVEDDGLQAIP